MTDGAREWTTAINVAVGALLTNCPVTCSCNINFRCEGCERKRAARMLRAFAAAKEVEPSPEERALAEAYDAWRAASVIPRPRCAALHGPEGCPDENAWTSRKDHARRALDQAHEAYRRARGN